jgi:diguanylate cyclase (GGDEF)-like protein/PAS domain S-box-containing protein
MPGLQNISGRWITAPLAKTNLFYLLRALVAAALVYCFTTTSLMEDVKSDVARQLKLCQELEAALPADKPAEDIDGNRLMTLVTEFDVSVITLRNDERTLKHDFLTASGEITADIDRLGRSWQLIRPLAAAAKTQGGEILQLKSEANRIAAALSRSEIGRKICIVLISALGIFLSIGGKQIVRTGLIGPMASLQKDITRLREDAIRAQRRAECSDQLSKDLIATVPAGVLILERDLKVVSANRACREILDLGAGEISDKGIDEIVPGELRRRIIETQLTGVPERNLELSVPRARVSIARSLCSNGDPYLIVGLQDERPSGAELESQQRYENLFNSSSDGIVVLDGKGCITDFNPAAQRIFGYTREEVLGNSVTTIVNRAPNPARTLGITQNVDARTKEGGTFPVEWRWYHIPSGSRTLLSAHVRDLSVDKRVEFLERDCLRVLEMVTNSKPLKAILYELTSMVERQDSSLMCAVSMLSQERLHYEAAPSLPADFLREIEGLPMGPKQCSCGTAAYNRKTVLVSDIATDPLWERRQHLAAAHDIHAGWSSPLFSGLGTVIGSFAMFRREPGAPDQSQLDLLEMASRLASVAIGQWTLTNMLVQQAHHDALTRLPNRVMFEERLQEAINHATRTDQPMAVLFVDLDRFKLVNDTLGHTLGDTLLSQVSQRLQAPLRLTDMLARMGGDEFTIIMSELRSPEEATAMAHRLLDVLRQPFDLDGYELFISASVGISMFPRDGRDAATLLRNADSAMYRAKDQGKNGFQVFAPEMSVRAREQLDVESSLHRALERGELSLYYQPQYDVESGQMVGLESLIRWQHPKLGVVLPGTFIPSAEESGLIVPIGDWVLDEATSQHRRWQKAGYAPMTVAVNVSARQFQHPQFVESVANALAKSGLDPGLLELELTETMVLQDIDKLAPRLNEVRELGVRIAIDDFGTGYSSLNYLQRLPFDTLKLDKSFVDEIKSGSCAAPLIESIVGMTHNLGMLVTAEGVETEAQLETLRRVGCDRMQGFLLSKPLPAESAELLFTSGASLEFLSEAVGAASAPTVSGSWGFRR